MSQGLPTINRTVRLLERPVGRVGSEHFTVADEPVAELADREVLVRVCWLAFEPAQRSWLNDIPTYIPPVQIGAVMRSAAAGQVVASRHPDFPVGQSVMGTLGWQSFATMTPDQQVEGLNDITKIDNDADMTMALGVLSIAGMTAYIGMADIGRPGPGSTVLVTAAAGAVGSLAGQIARVLGATRVIGTASSEEKRAWVRDVAGFDDCLDYRDPKIFRLMRAAAPDGYDVVFDNVGGTLLDNALALTSNNARVVPCGAISTGYGPSRTEIGLRNYQFITTRRITMQGFIVTDHEARFPTARADLLRWIAEGKVHHAVDVVEGIENAPATLQRLFDGGNLGKQLLRVADPIS